MSVGYNPKIVTNGLVLYLDAANVKSYPGSGTTWTDLSGNGNNATLTDTTFSNLNGGEIVYGATGIAATSYTLGATFTYSVWYRPTSLNTGAYQSIIGSYSTGFICLIIEPSTPIIKAWNETYTGGDIMGTPNLSTNTWYNFCFTRTGNSVTSTGYNMYFNGALTGSSSSGTRAQVSPFTLGGRPDSVQPPAGRIAYGSVYNRALSQAEIQQNFNALRGRFGI